MKYAARFFAMVLMMAPLLASAQLTRGHTLAANVPFQFRAGEKVVPAGKCTVQRAGGSIGTLTISNWAGKVSLFTTVSPHESKQTSAKNALVFRKYGDHYFLAGIKLAGSKILYQLPESKADAEMRAQNMPATEQNVLALLQ